MTARTISASKSTKPLVIVSESISVGLTNACCRLNVRLGFGNKNCQVLCSFSGQGFGLESIRPIAMVELKETRSLNIQDKVVKLSDIRRLAKELTDLFKASKKRKEKPSLNFRVTNVDGSIYESEDPALFDEESIVTSRRVSSVFLGLYSYDSNFKRIKDVRINLQHTLSDAHYYQNEIEISGTYSTWVNGTIANLKKK